MKSFFKKIRFRVGRQTARLLLFLAAIPFLYGVYSRALAMPSIQTLSDGWSEQVFLVPSPRPYGILAASFAAPIFVWLLGELLSKFTLFFKNHPYLTVVFSLLPFFGRVVWDALHFAVSWAALPEQLWFGINIVWILLGSFVVLYLARCAFLSEEESVSDSELETEKLCPTQN